MSGVFEHLIVPVIVGWGGGGAGGGSGGTPWIVFVFSRDACFSAIESCVYYEPAGATCAPVERACVYVR